MMKKILALVCVLAMILTVCGCRETKVETSTLSYFEGEEVITSDSHSNDKENDSVSDSSTGNSSTGTISTGSNSVIDDPLKADLKGAEIIIYDINSVFSPDASRSKTHAAKADMIKKLQKELNCKITVKNTDMDKLKTLVSTSAAGGKGLKHIIVVDMYEMGYFITSNLVADMGKISSMDLSKDYMNKANFLESTRLGKGTYAVACDGSIGSAVLYNKRILGEMGYSENYIYDLVDAGKWNYTEFRKLAKQATKDLDGKPGMSSEDQWGVVAMNVETSITGDLLASANTSMLKFSNGKLVSNMSDPNVVKVANLMKETYKDDGILLDVNGSKAHEAFKSGKVFMEYTTSNTLEDIFTMKDEYGFVPAPKIDGAKNYVSVTNWNYEGLMIPSGLSAQDQYNAGAVVQGYMYLMQDVYKTKKAEFANRYLCDDESSKNFDIVLNTVTSSPELCYAESSTPILNGTYRVFWRYLNGENPSATAGIESTSSALKKELDDIYNKVRDK